MTAEQLQTFSFNNLKDPHDLELNMEWVVESFLPARSVTMLSGESGSGKSTVTLMLADAIANGKPFLGLPTKQGKVLIVDRENGGAIYKERFDRLKIPKQDNIAYWGGWEDNEPEGPTFEPYLQIAKAEQPTIIFDSFIAFMDEGSEQDATEVRNYMNAYRKLAQAGATVVFIHHTGKSDGSKAYRGSSDIKASVDTAWLLKAKPKVQDATLTNLKSREGIVEDLAFYLDETVLIAIEHGYIKVTDPDWVKVVTYILQHPGTNQTQIVGANANISRERVLKILTKAVQMKQLVLSRGLKNAALYTANVVDAVQ